MTPTFSSTHQLPHPLPLPQTVQLQNVFKLGMYLKSHKDGGSGGIHGFNQNIVFQCFPSIIIKIYKSKKLYKMHLTCASITPALIYYQQKLIT